jgi:PKD repeat protein
VAEFTWSPLSGARVDFDATGSVDYGSIASYSWDFGAGGATGSGVTPTYQYPGPGTYRVTLTLTDDAGLTGSASQSVIVPGAPSTPSPPTQSGSMLVWAPVAGVRRYLVDFEFFANGCARTLAGQAVPAGPAPSRAIPPNLCPGTATARARYAVDINGQVAYSAWIDVTTPATPTTAGPGQVVK